MPNTTPRRSTHKRRGDVPSGFSDRTNLRATRRRPWRAIRLRRSRGWPSHRHRVPELPLTVLALLLRRIDHVTEHREQRLLRRRHDRVGDLGLLPEDPPVRLLRRRRAVHLGLAGGTISACEILAQLEI